MFGFFLTYSQSVRAKKKKKEKKKNTLVSHFASRLVRLTSQAMAEAGEQKLTAAGMVKALGLVPHPEGGFFLET